MTSAGSNAWRLLLGRWAINLLPSPHEKVPSLTRSVLGNSTMFLTRGDRCPGLWSGNWYRFRAAKCLEYALTITTLYGVTNLMSQSLTHLLVHAIFSTKDRRPFLR